MITLKNVSYCYPREERPALRNINLEIRENEIMGIIGCNASGKSTLVRLLNGLIIPTTGQVVVDGLKSSVPENLALIRQKVALLRAEPDNQLVTNLVEEDVAFGPENWGLASHEIRKRVDTALKMVSMEDYAKYPPYLLSGGQKQRVCIAGLLVMRPKYMVMDEPTAMLDPQGKKEVRKILSQLKVWEGLTIIIISHELEELLQADRLVWLEDGEIKLQDRSRNLLTRVEVLREAGLEGLEISRLIEQINKAGYAIPGDILSPAGLVEEICRLK